MKASSNLRNVESLTSCFERLKITFLPEVVKTVKEFAPKLVAMSIGWMARVNMMSDTARAMMKTSADSSFFRRRVMTTMTRRLKKKLTKTTR